MMNQMDREKLMKMISQASFAMDDTRLFLDTHPNCQEAIEYYNKAKKAREAAKEEYTRKYGPLSYYQIDVENHWTWNEGPMPWEGGNC